jgi:hypothetical protein
VGEKKQKIIQLRGGRQNLSCCPCALKKGDNMKKYLIVLCLVFVFAFTSGFLISHFTAQSSKANSGCDVSHDCGHDSQIQQLMREIEIRQDRIKDLEQRINFYHEAIVEMLRQFDIQFDWINELLGLINETATEIHELEKEIVKLQTQVDYLSNQGQGQHGFPVQWNGIWGIYWERCCCDDGGYEFDKLVTIKHGNIAFEQNIDDDAEISTRIIGNTLLVIFEYDDYYTQAAVFTYCAFNDFFILSDLLVLFTEDDFDDFDNDKIKRFLDTDYYFVSLADIGHGTIVIEREGVK